QANSFPRSEVKDFKASLGKFSLKSSIAVCIATLERFGMGKAIYIRLFRSAKLAKQPLLLPREETTVSSSQCPNSFRFFTDLGRFEMGVPILNFPRVS